MKILKHFYKLTKNFSNSKEVNNLLSILKNIQTSIIKANDINKNLSELQESLSEFSLTNFDFNNEQEKINSFNKSEKNFYRTAFSNFKYIQNCIHSYLMYTRYISHKNSNNII